MSLDLAGRRVVVAGGGPVAARRTRDLVDAGALVDLVSPWVCEDLADLIAQGSVRWVQRAVRGYDVVHPSPAWLVHTATGDREADDLVANRAAQERIWCVRADDAERSSAWRPAVAHGARGTPAEGVSVAVTAGADPRRALDVRDAVLAGLATGALPTRRRRATAGPQDGVVHLVGSGPGEESLLTLRARTLLASADVVVTDRLGATSVLRSLAPHVEVIDVGKTPGHHPVPQHRINELLVEHARRGRVVVRLKGGDPFVLGRGGEEALHCRAQGVPVTVTPGLTSAISVPAAAGIPVTHRGVTDTVVVASAHSGLAEVDRALSGAAPTATVVLLMGVAMLAQVCQVLTAHGRPTSTPVAVIENGWTADQRLTTGTLDTICALARAHGVAAPAIIVVGDVVDLAEPLGDLRSA